MPRIEFRKAPDNFEPLLQMLEKNDPLLLELDLHGIQLTQPQILRIASALKGNNNLKSLILRRCALNPNKILWLTNAIAENQSLEKLDCSDNPNLKAGGVSAIIMALHQNKSIKKLALAHSGVDSGCLHQITEMLKTNRSLIYLNLSFNKLLYDHDLLNFTARLKSTSILYLDLWNVTQNKLRFDSDYEIIEMETKFIMPETAFSCLGLFFGYGIKNSKPIEVFEAPESMSVDDSVFNTETKQALKIRY